MAKNSKYDSRMKMDEVKKEIASGHSRVAAILAGAVLDEVLAVTIEFNLIELSKNEKRGLIRR